MDQTKVETNDLETMEKRDNSISRVSEIGCSEAVGTRRGGWKKSLAYVRLTCDKPSPKQRIFS